MKTMTYIHCTYKGHEMFTTRAIAVAAAEANPDFAYYYMTAAGQPVFKVQVWAGKFSETQEAAR
jgi:hypothetical protein